MADLGSVVRAECDTCASGAMNQLLGPTSCAIGAVQQLQGRLLQVLATRQQRDAGRVVRNAD
jgi:hypothetical protein